MIEEIAVLGSLGFFFSTLLVVMSKRFAVQMDERVERVRELLPGASCGACGFGGCDDFAEALVKDPSLLGNCRLMGADERRRAGALLGIEVKETWWMVANVRCAGGSKVLFDWVGEKTCSAASSLGEGVLACKYGCIGLGDCVRACPFGAIELRGNTPVVDEDKCRGCGLCVNACPRGVIKLIPKDAKVIIRCNSPEPGKVVAAACPNGCIACKLCEKACQVGAIKIENNLPVIDQSLCTSCGACVEACKRKVLVLRFPKPLATPHAS